MSSDWTLALVALVIGPMVVLAALGLLALVTKGISLVDRRLKDLERKPVLKETALDPRIVAAIVAAISAAEKRRFHIHRIRYLAPQVGEDAWQDFSRAQQLIARRVPRKG
ncbi:MAG: hypothetical protein PHI18_06775 [bacterium]|nr:hypothetical protein [bacterium]